MTALAFGVANMICVLHLCSRCAVLWLVESMSTLGAAKGSVVQPKPGCFSVAGAATGRGAQQTRPAI